MAGDLGLQYGLFPAGYQGGIAGDPLVLYDSNYYTMVFSPMSAFLTAISNMNSTDNTLIAGIQGRLLNILYFHNTLFIDLRTYSSLV